MPAFPSLEWLQALRDIVNSDPDFRKFGTIDCEMGMEVGDRHWKVVFEAFEVTDVAPSTAAETDELDFVLSQPPDAWREMIENIKVHGAADLPTPSTPSTSKRPRTSPAAPTSTAATSSTASTRPCKTSSTPST